MRRKTMQNTLNNLLMFTAGAVIGSVVTWKLVKTKYEQIANEEIESVKEVLGRGHRTEIDPMDEIDDDEDEDDEEYTPSEEDIARLKETISTNGYRRYSTKKEEKEEEDVDKPYVISPEEFARIDEDDYETVSLVYYADGVLTDEQDNIIEDVESMVGEDSLTHFGEFEDDSVFVRNDRLQTAYEILRDTRRYDDVY
jgi:hypothetical protein